MPSEAEAHVLPKDSGSTFWEGVQEEAGVAKYIRVTLPAVPLSPHPTCPDLCGIKVRQKQEIAQS